jgi:hypothetical protein
VQQTLQGQSMNRCVEVEQLSFTLQLPGYFISRSESTFITRIIRILGQNYGTQLSLSCWAFFSENNLTVWSTT